MKGREGIFFKVHIIYVGGVFLVLSYFGPTPNFSNLFEYAGKIIIIGIKRGNKSE